MNTPDDSSPPMTDRQANPPRAFMAAIEAELTGLVDRIEREIAEQGLVTAQTASQLHELRLKIEATVGEAAADDA